MERKPYPSEVQERFIIRFPAGMRDRIAEAAKTNGRSMNAEIVRRLALSLDADEIRSEPPMEYGELPPGAEIDHGTQVWAERLTQPQNRKDLEGLLAVIRAMLGRSGLHFDGPREERLSDEEAAKLASESSGKRTPPLSCSEIT